MHDLPLHRLEPLRRITGYFFEQPDKEYLRVWDVPDDGPAPDWEDLFEPASE